MLYKGEVTRVDAEGVHVVCPDLGIDLEFGPLECVQPSATSPILVAAGDRVLLASVNNVRDDLVVIGVLTLVVEAP